MSHNTLGWLKWREFGRRVDTASDQVIQVVKDLELKRALDPVAASWSDSQAGSYRHFGLKIAGWRKEHIKKSHASDL